MVGGASDPPATAGRTVTPAPSRANNGNRSRLRSRTHLNPPFLHSSVTGSAGNSHARLGTAAVEPPRTPSRADPSRRAKHNGRRYSRVAECPRERGGDARQAHAHPRSAVPDPTRGPPVSRRVGAVRVARGRRGPRPGDLRPCALAAPRAARGRRALLPPARAAQHVPHISSHGLAEAGNGRHARGRRHRRPQADGPSGAGPGGPGGVRDDRRAARGLPAGASGGGRARSLLQGGGPRPARAGGDTHDAAAPGAQAGGRATDLRAAGRRRDRGGRGHALGCLRPSRSRARPAPRQTATGAMREETDAGGVFSSEGTQ